MKNRIAECIKKAARIAEKRTAQGTPLLAPRFVIGGKPYVSQAQLTAERIHETELIYRDCYGRMVLLIHERYPTFDSYDALYENRYFHNYYVKTPEGFAFVRTADDQADSPVQEGIPVETFVREHLTWHRPLLEAAGLMRSEEK